jgi:hypothetical protein
MSQIETYLNLANLLKLIDSPNREKCQKMYNDNQKLFEYAKGSSSKHQAWKGGYIDHLEEIMNLAIMLYGTMNKLRELSFSLSDALFVLFIHDLEKPWKYSKNPNDLARVKDASSVKNFIFEILKIYDIALNDEQNNAFKYIHGEGSDYDPENRVQLPLAAFVHCCDTISARIWFDEPR